MTVNSHLTSMSTVLYPSQSERDSIARSIGTLRGRLSAYFASGEMKDQIQFGSSTRGTMLPRKADPQSDVDYMVVFDNTENFKPQTFLDRLKRFASSKYGSSEIHQSHPTVVLELDHIMFELVPAYRNWSGTLYIPGPVSGYMDWISTDPNGVNTKLEDKNKSNDSQIKPTIRLLKYWNAKKGYVFNSYDLEQWVVNNPFGSIGELRKYFFEAVNDVRESYGMPQSKIDAIRRAKEIVQETKRLEEGGYPSLAEAEIKKLIPEL
jgi:hypothetical protein